MLGGALMQSCDKDTYNYLDVEVLDPTRNNAGVPHALVMIYADGSSVGDTGYTDSDGIYSTKFAAPGIFTIKAQLQVADTPSHPLDQWYCHRDGMSNAKLKVGETVGATVYLTSEVVHDRR